MTTVKSVKTDKVQPYVDLKSNIPALKGNPERYKSYLIRQAQNHLSMVAPMCEDPTSDVNCPCDNNECAYKRHWDRLNSLIVADAKKLSDDRITVITKKEEELQDVSKFDIYS
jgi:hypothetical protein